MTDYRNPPETPEAVAWELLKEIMRAEEAEGHVRNVSARSRVLTLYAECLSVANGRAPGSGLSDAGVYRVH